MVKYGGTVKNQVERLIQLRYDERQSRCNPCRVPDIQRFKLPMKGRRHLYWKDTIFRARDL